MQLDIKIGNIHLDFYIKISDNNITPEYEYVLEKNFCLITVRKVFCVERISSQYMEKIVQWFQMFSYIQIVPKNTEVKKLNRGSKKKKKSKKKYKSCKDLELQKKNKGTMGCKYICRFHVIE